MARSAAKTQTRPREDDVAEFLAAIGQLVRRVRAEARGAGELGLGPMSILARLEAGAMTTADLARAEAMKPQSMGAVLQQMEEEGWVRRRPHPTDGRQILFERTQAGAARRDSARRVKREWLMAAIARLSPDQQQALFAARDVLRLLADLIPAVTPKDLPMPLTQLDAKAALVVIDLQKGIVALPSVHPMADIVANAAALTRAFRARNLPVVLVNVAGRPPGRTETVMNFSPPPDWADFIPELEQQPSDYAVTKMNIGAFYGTALDRILRRAGVTQIFLCGVATGIGVEATARQAFDIGYNVVTVTDAMTDLSADSHRHAVEHVFPRIAERTTTQDALAKLT